MKKSLWVALLSAALVTGPALAGEKKRSAAKKKVETGASCKAPAVGRCAACSIACQPGETAHCGGGAAVADVCHTQPVCKCTK
jgi:hypothetical protein